MVYASVSTEDQNLEIQRDRLSVAGCEMMFEEKISGAARGRPELEKLMGHLRKDDVLVVARLDRFARSTVQGWPPCFARWSRWGFCRQCRPGQSLP